MLFAQRCLYLWTFFVFGVCCHFAWAATPSKPLLKPSAQRTPTPLSFSSQKVAQFRFHTRPRRSRQQLSRVVLPDNWRRSRWWWSFQLGRLLHNYTPTQVHPPETVPLYFVGYTLGARVGWAKSWYILTADLQVAFGEASTTNLVDAVGGYMVRGGGTIGFPVQPFLTLEVGTSLMFFQYEKTRDSAAALYVPLHLGFTFRVPVNRYSMGVRIITTSTFDLASKGFVLGGSANLVFESV